MGNNGFSFKGINRQSKLESALFMLIGAILSNIPAITDWLTNHTHLSASIITIIGMFLGYLAKAFVMPSPASPINTPTVLPPNL